MSLTPRPVRIPRLVGGSWALSIVAGAGLVAAGPHPARPEPDALNPYSLASYLRRIAGPDAQQIRVNGVYGSGHNGAWQLVAHLSWHDPDGRINGGTTTLPQFAGAPALDSTFDPDRLEAEERIGWTLEELDQVLDKYNGVNDPLAMLELEILPDGAGTATLCHGEPQLQADCEDRDRTGHRHRSFNDELSDEPLREALSVQRRSKPVVS